MLGASSVMQPAFCLCKRVRMSGKQWKRAAALLLVLPCSVRLSREGRRKILRVPLSVFVSMYRRGCVGVWGAVMGPWLYFGSCL